MTSPATSFLTVTTKSDVVARSVGDETILLDLESGIYFTLNPVGGVVWRSIELGESFDATLGAVLDRFEVDEARATADIGEYLESLVSEGLVVRK